MNRQYAWVTSARATPITEWRPTALARWSMWVVFAFLALLIIGQVSIALEDGGGGAVLRIAVTIAIVGPLTLVVLRVARFMRIADEGSDLVLVSILSKRRIPWSDVVAAAPGYAGIAVTLQNGDTALAGAVQKSNIAKWRGLQTRADEVAEYINVKASPPTT